MADKPNPAAAEARAKPAQRWDTTTVIREDDGTDRAATDAETWDLILRLDDDRNLGIAGLRDSDEGSTLFADDITAEDMACVVCDIALELRSRGHNDLAEPLFDAAWPVFNINLGPKAMPPDRADKKLADINSLGVPDGGQEMR